LENRFRLSGTPPFNWSDLIAIVAPFPTVYARPLHLDRHRGQICLLAHASG